MYRNEIARTSYLKSKVLETSGSVEQATQLRAEAIEIRSTILGKPTTVENLTEDDFDDLVTFWSK